MTRHRVDPGTGRSTTGPAPAGARASRAVPGPTSGSAAEPATVEAHLLQGSHIGALACDERRVVRSANAAAARLLPGLAVGEVLPARFAALTGAGGEEAVELEVGGRALTARRQDLPDDWTGWHVEDVTEPRSRMDGLLAERARSRFLAEASNRLELSLHPGRTARTSAQLASRLADAAVVVLPVAAGTAQWFRCGADGAGSGRLLARDLPAPVAAALDGLAVPPAPLLPAELRGEPWAPQAPTAGAVVTALPGNGKPAGALVLLRHADQPADAGPDVPLVHEFAQHAGIALAAAALYAQQARTAGVLTRSLLEPRLPEVAGVALGAAYRPADEGLLIGGDFYDVLPARPADPDGAVVMLGDVCGKGVDAAVATGQLRQSVRALRRVEPDPVRLLELLDATMLEAVPDDADPRFVTLVLGTTRPLPGGGLRLVLAGGGHPAPLVVRRDGGVEVVEIGGTLVGGMRRARFRSRTVDLAPGEACVLYTDGVTEARGGLDGAELFGEERLAELLRGCHVLPAPGIAERITQRVDRWLATTGNHDDIAVLVLQAPLPVGPPARRHLHSVTASDAADPTGAEEGPA